MSKKVKSHLQHPKKIRRRISSNSGYMAKQDLISAGLMDIHGKLLSNKERHEVWEKRREAGWK